MSPEEACGSKPVRTIYINSSPDIIFHKEGRATLLRGHNSRGAIEILISPEKQIDQLPKMLSDQPLSLTGFFRRRSGRRSDGSRHFIWCLVLLSASHSDDLEVIQ